MSGALSQGISTALTHTFLGLFLAVPCLAAFGVLRTIVDRLTVRGALVAEELLLMIKPAENKPGVVPGARPVAAPTVMTPPPPPMRQGPHLRRIAMNDGRDQLFPPGNWQLTTGNCFNETPPPSTLARQSSQCHSAD